MKKAIRLLTVLFAGLILFGLTSKTPVSAAQAKLNASKKTIQAGASFTLTLSGAEGKVTWKSSDKSVATVKKGTVTAVAPGKTKITAKNGGNKYTCKITVIEAKETKADKLTLEEHATGITADLVLLMGEFGSVQTSLDDPENYESYVIDSEGNVLIHEVLSEILLTGEFNIDDSPYVILDNDMILSDFGRFYTPEGERLINKELSEQDLIYVGYSPFSGGIAVVSFTDSQYENRRDYLINEKFEILAEVNTLISEDPYLVQFLYTTSEGMSALICEELDPETGEVKNHELLGFYNKKGKLIVPKDENGQSYKSGLPVFSDGLAPVWNSETDLLGFINKKGKLVIPCEYKALYGSGFKNGYALVTKVIDGEEKTGVIDKKGNVVVPFEYDNKGFTPVCCSGVLTLVKNDMIGILSRKGKEIVPFEYVRLNKISDNFIHLVDKNEKDCILTLKGKTLIPTDEYAWIWGLGEQTLIVGDGDGTNTALIDLNDTVLTNIDGNLQYAYLNENLGMIGYEKDGKLGYTSFDGKVVVPFEYDDISHFSANGIGYGIKDKQLYVLKLK